ncbi:radical SAM protein [Treponema primitia]|uniref:4Fe-4S single cluster domain-containing protein n=1 Tax=Treponema primitia TaxID=88058 RepID=UPI0039803E5E
MNIAHIEECSYIYGPGRRFVIWTQGCSLRCKGCWNTSMWSFRPKVILSVEALYEKIDVAAAAPDGIEGITLLGGEPLDQYEETTELLRLCKQAGISVILFTGYEMAEIAEKKALFDLTDILISGRYEQERRTLNHQWIGSTNQEIHFLSERYKDYKKRDVNYMEIAIEESGSVTILGFPPEEFLHAVNLKGRR